MPYTRKSTKYDALYSYIYKICCYPRAWLGVNITSKIEVLIVCLSVQRVSLLISAISVKWVTNNFVLSAGYTEAPPFCDDLCKSYNEAREHDARAFPPQ